MSSLADQLGEQGRDADQHAVAGIVAERVVDRLEVVEVEDRQGQVAAGVLAADPVERAGEVAPVVQAGEPVAVGLLAQLLGLAAGLDGLEVRPLQAQLQLRELAERLALQLGAAVERA